MTAKAKFLFLISWVFIVTACQPKPTKQVPEEYKKGQAAFHRVCSNCHGSDALGGQTKAPSLIDEDFILPDWQDEDIRRTVIEGSDSKKMPSQRSQVTDNEIEEIIKYLRYSQNAAGLSSESEDEIEDDEEEI